MATTRIDVGILISEMSERVERLVAEGVVLSDQTDLRMRLYLACLINEFLRQASLPKPKPDEADVVVELALGLLGVTPARAKKLVGTPLPPLGELPQ